MVLGLGRKMVVMGGFMSFFLIFSWGGFGFGWMGLLVGVMMFKFSLDSLLRSVLLLALDCLQCFCL